MLNWELFKRLHRGWEGSGKAGVKKIIAVGEYASDVAGAAVEAGISSKRVFAAEN